MKTGGQLLWGLVPALLLPLGCFGTPTPLAPGLMGSVGLPNHGVLTNGTELPVRGAGYERFRPRSPRYFGSPRLVAAVERATRAVAEQAPGGEPLLIGDFSARHGGRISGHSSHRSGRDVDLLFYTLGPSSLPVRCPGFVHFGPDGLAPTPEGKYVALDRQRNWLLVKNLLSNLEIDVLWLFVSRDVEALLIDEAWARGESIDLIWRAQRVLHQPRDSANHDDHFHLRIACSPSDRVTGCEGGGPAWPWLKIAVDPDESLPPRPWMDLEPATGDV